jgi:uncharacterized protein YijF (DUF1287 family)
LSGESLGQKNDNINGFSALQLLESRAGTMARQRSGFYHTIEYIGPRPEKPKRRNFFGGWVIIVIAVGVSFWFVNPLMPSLKANQVKASSEQAEVLIAALGESKVFGEALAAAALGHSGEEVTYDPAYYQIGYPDGDVPPGKGVAADVLVRCFRKLGLDLQVLVHEDMAENFRLYPQLWDASGPDTNIDHRRVENLQVFFERNCETLSVTRRAADYLPGDIVVWSLANAEMHIGIVVPGPGERSGEPWVVHNMGAGVKWENVIFDYSVHRHFRFPASKAGAAPGRL